MQVEASPDPLQLREGEKTGPNTLAGDLSGTQNVAEPVSVRPYRSVDVSMHTPGLRSQLSPPARRRRIV